MGTPEYMSPEQATGLIEEIDHRADQWALGCITWEMLSGHAPFIAEDMAALFYQVINMDPHPLSRRAPGLPADVEPVLRRALAKRPADRFPSIKDFSRAFETAATSKVRELTPPPMVIRRTTPMKGTVAYSERPPSVRPGQSVPQAMPPARTTTLPEEPLSTGAAQGDDPDDDEAPRRPRLAYYSIAAAAMVLLVAVVLLLWPRKQQVSASHPSTQGTLAPAVVPRPPEVVTLPTSTPTPAPPPTLAPTPSPAIQAAAPIQQLEPSHAPKAKAPKGTSDSPSKSASADKPAGVVGRKPSPYADPFEFEPPSPKPAKPKQSRAQPQRTIIEDL